MKDLAGGCWGVTLTENSNEALVIKQDPQTKAHDQYSKDLWKREWIDPETIVYISNLTGKIEFFTILSF